MKTKQRSVCNNCRKRKLGCDGKRPECTQCRLTRRTCDGYPEAWTFVPQKVKTRAKAKGNDGESGSSQYEVVQDQPLYPIHAFPSGPVEVSAHVSRIIHCYMPTEERVLSMTLPVSQPRICGSWVEVLPDLSSTAKERHSALESAIRAFGMSVTHASSGALVVAPESSHAYYLAIRALRASFDLSAGRFRADLAAAIMCLGMAELMFPERPSGLTAHIKGVGALFQAQGPEMFRSGIFHRLFVGFLPLLTIDAFRSREPTFLAAREWRCEPFKFSPPSVMQMLLGEAAIIPSLLHRIDQECKSSSEPNISVMEDIATSLIDVLCRLQRLEDSLENDGHRPYGQIPSPDFDLPSTDFALWFPSITTANVLAHLWTFKIVCLTELRDLATFFPPVLDQPLSNGIHPSQLGGQIIELSILTCRSMEFTLQDKMALYGPASTFYPLQIAYKSLKNSSAQHKNAAYCESVVERLVAKGLRAVPHIVFGT